MSACDLNRLITKTLFPIVINFTSSQNILISFRNSYEEAIHYFCVYTVYHTRNKGATASPNCRTCPCLCSKFYDWYTVLYNTRANKNTIATADIVALNKKANYFDPQLRKAIIADANANVRGEIVGFDSDPFLNAQDDGFTYLTGNVKQVGSSFFIDLHAGLAGKSKKAILNSEAVVIAEVANVNGAWRFKNFFYPYKGKKEGL